MPSYLIDEGGERTHAVIPIEEYDRLRRATEKLETVRGFAHEMVATLNGTENGTGPHKTEVEDKPVPQAGPQAGSPWSHDSSRERNDWNR